MNLSLHIERLVLEGLPVTSKTNALLLQTALEAELGQLLQNHFTPGTVSSALAHVAGHEIRIHPQISATDLGRRIGQSLFLGLDSAGIGSAPEAPFAAARQMAPGSRPNEQKTRAKQ